VLVVLVGRATRLAQFLAGAEKEYEATVRFGYATDTGDLTGARRDDEEYRDRECASLAEEEIESALAALRGEIEQVPPMYSAKKVQGRKLYELARRGEEVERKAVRVRVSEFEIMDGPDGAPWLRRNDDGTCDLSTRVVCSAGTYVRVLGESLGERLGVGAHLATLRRTRAGSFRIEGALTLERFEGLAEGRGVGAKLLSTDAALSHLPAAHLTDDEARKVRHGAAVGDARAPQGLKDGAHVRLRDAEGSLLAVAVYDAARRLLRPRVMLAAE
jgi:tRNA pseudouridine55 synthase